MNLVSNKYEKVFLCLNSKVDITTKVDIILSPEFYWVRVFDIPVKGIKQAKDVLPTLFEDIIDTNEKLDYELIEIERSKYLCFAYSNKKIFEYLKSININLSLINNIYFAQNECKSQNSFSINENCFLYTQDDILVKVPNSLLSEKKELDINSIVLSSNNMDIKLYNSSLNGKYLVIIAILLLLFTSVNFYKFFIYKNEVSKNENKIEQIKSSSNLPSSMLRTKSIIDSYETKVKKEIEKRELISYVLSNKKIKIKRLELDNNSLDISLEGANKSYVENYISKRYKIVSSRVNGLVLNIRIKL